MGYLCVPCYLIFGGLVGIFAVVDTDTRRLGFIGRGDVSGFCVLCHGCRIDWVARLPGPVWDVLSRDSCVPV